MKKYFIPSTEVLNYQTQGAICGVGSAYGPGSYLPPMGDDGEAPEDFLPD